jgi:hypothetical protein
MSRWGVPAITAPELIGCAKANPGRIRLALTDPGSAPHASGELFRMITGLDVARVALSRGPAALKGTIEGKLELMFEPLSASLEPRWPTLPRVPRCEQKTLPQGGWTYEKQTKVTLAAGPAAVCGAVPSDLSAYRITKAGRLEEGAKNRHGTRRSSSLRSAQGCSRPQKQAC